MIAGDAHRDRSRLPITVPGVPIPAPSLDSSHEDLFPLAPPEMPKMNRQPPQTSQQAHQTSQQLEARVNPAEDRFKYGKAFEFPEVPGGAYRSSEHPNHNRPSNTGLSQELSSHLDIMTSFCSGDRDKGN